MMKTVTLTFHGSHNYGSMLQSYALQQTMMRIFGENEILNFRSRRQKRMMSVISFRLRLGPVLKDLTHLLFWRDLSEKHKLFESFLKHNLKTSVKEVEEVESNDLTGFNLICCGSDQIWNPGPEDFDLAYLLPFKLDAKKISYAASMGPGRAVWPEPISKFPELLKDFFAISVREEGTRKWVSQLCGRDDIKVHCDPVFLIDKTNWLRLVDSTPIINGKYIFLYTLFANKLIIDCAKALSKKFGMPVVISNYTNHHDLFSPFKKYLRSGPKEFLNMLYNAEMVVTSSFHGTAFSILLNKPFVTIDGIIDNRISNLLSLTGLSARSVSSVAEIKDIDWALDFTEANHAIEKERDKSFDYLFEFKQ